MHPLHPKNPYHNDGKRMNYGLADWDCPYERPRGQHWGKISQIFVYGVFLGLIYKKSQRKKRRG